MVRDREALGGRGHDSQGDSHSVRRWQPSANGCGSRLVTFHHAQTLLDAGGRQKRGLQNRLGSSADVHTSSPLFGDVRRRRDDSQ